MAKKALLLFIFFLSACQGNGAVAVSTTSQTLSNQGLQFLAAAVQQVQQALQGASHCAPFQQALDQLVGTESCAMGGAQSLQASDTSCEDSPLFSGQATLSLNLQDCLEPGQTLGGIVLFDMDWDGSLLTSQVTSGDFSFNGLTYSIQNLNIGVDATGTAECSGTLLIDGNLCGVTSDCNFCPF
jgi:hypothetical protein